MAGRLHFSHFRSRYSIVNGSHKSGDARRHNIPNSWTHKNRFLLVISMFGVPATKRRKQNGCYSIWRHGYYTVETTFWLCSIENAWIASVYRIRRRKLFFPLNLQYRSAPISTACTFPPFKPAIWCSTCHFRTCNRICNDTRTGTHLHIISSAWLYLAAHASCINRRTGKKQAVKTSSAAITTSFN